MKKCDQLILSHNIQFCSSTFFHLFGRRTSAREPQTCLERFPKTLGFFIVKDGALAWRKRRAFIKKS